MRPAFTRAAATAEAPVLVYREPDCESLTVVAGDRDSEKDGAAVATADDACVFVLLGALVKALPPVGTSILTASTD